VAADCASLPLSAVSARAFGVFIAVLAVLGLLAFGLAKKSADALEVGDAIPTTSLPKLDGDGTGSVADYRGRWLLVNVWASWCPPCKDESPTLERFYRAHRGGDFEVLGVDTNDLSGDALAFVRGYGLTYPQLRDGSGDFAQDELGTTGMPESFLVDPRGNLVLHRIGSVTGDYLRSNVVPYLTGRATE
jgi:cytochrome c biogenesis protein CcmG/thiol:disulfide interchange protein DsbE